MGKKVKQQFNFVPPSEEDEERIEVSASSQESADEYCRILGDGQDGDSTIIKVFRPACENSLYIDKDLLLAVAEYVKKNL